MLFYVKYLLSLRNVEDLLAERSIDISHETLITSGTGSARCSQLISAGIALAARGASASGDNTLMNCT